MNILKEKVDVTNESKARFQQLQIAHTSTIMVYAKVDIQGHGLVKEMARKLRPEFGRFFVTTDVRDCIKLIEKHNCDESIPGIDLVIMDADHNSIKFLDMINKRPRTKATASLPLISTVMVLPEAATGGHLQTGLTPKEAQNQIYEVGGASHVCNHKNTIQEVFYCVLDSLSHRKTVESAFRDLKAAKIKAAKYPFLPIFSKKISVGEEDNSDTDDDFAGFDEKSVESEKLAGSNSSVEGSHTSLKELDDWTDSSSMLPEFIRNSRNQVVQDIRNRHSTPHLNLKVEGRDGKKEKGVMSIQERQAADKNIIKFLNTGQPLESMPQAYNSPSGSPRNMGDNDATLSRPGSAASGQADETQVKGTEESKTNTDSKSSIKSKNRAAAEAAAMANASRGRGARPKVLTPAPQTTVSEVKASEAAKKRTAEPESGEFDEEVSMMDESQGHDADDLTIQTPYAASESPSISSPSSRAKRGAIMFKGLRHGDSILEHLMEPHQRPTFKKASLFKMNRKGTDIKENADQGDATSLVSEISAQGSMDQREGRNSSTLDAFISKDTPDLTVVHSVGGLDKYQAMEQWQIINASKYDMEQLKGGHLSDDTHHASAAKADEQGASRANVFVSDKSRNDRDVGGKKHLSGSEKKRAATDPAITTAATRTLKRMARDTPADVQFDHLIEIELSHGKVTVGDRDLLDAGQKAEKEGLHDVAIALYKRAGLHTNKPHLSQLFLARTHYYLGKFMMALEHLNNAIDFQNKIKHLALFSSDDHFVAYYNRAMVNFRLGDDERGVTDLEEAIRLRPDDLRAKNVYPIALRRLGRFSEAIESSKQNNLMKKERARREKEEEILLKEKRASRRLSTRTSPVADSVSTSGKLGGLSEGVSVEIQESHGRPASRSGMQTQINDESMGHSQMQHGEWKASHDDTTTEAGSQVLTIHCKVEDQGGGSFRSRKGQRERQLMRDGTTTGQVGEALRVFKLTNGFREDLFEELFTEPSELQKSLVVHPGKRTVADIEIISTTLRLFPLLRPLDSSALNELAQTLEYRAVRNGQEQSIFSQNTGANGVVLLLRGELQGRLESNDPTTGKLVVDIVEPYQASGYIDAMFLDEKNPIIRELYMGIKRDRDSQASAADTLALEESTQGKLDAPGRMGSAAATGTGVGDIDKRTSTRNIGADFSQRKQLSPPGSPMSGMKKKILTPTHQEDMEPLPEKLPRPLQPGMFITYEISHRLTELLVINEKIFSKLIYPLAAAEFNRRVDSVEGCAVFKGWPKEDVIRMARMGRMRTYRSGDLILKQGTKPEYLYLIMKGMCKSYKAPNKSTVLSAKLASAKEKAEKHDLKYCFDSRLRNSLSKGQLDIHPKTSERRRRSLMAKSHVTVSEAVRYSLGVEIKLLEKELAKAIEAEEAHALEEMSMDEAKESITSKLSEVSTLQWPQLFGESCVIDPANGTSHGTIVADTTLEVLCIHKSQLQTFRIKPELLERIKYRSVCYPEDEELLAQKERQEAWEQQRLGIVNNLSTPKEEYLEPFYV